jgi:HK97 family phage portal protein
LFGDKSSFADEAVSEESALAVPAVFCAVNFIADKVAGLPLNVFRKTADGREKLESGTLQRIVHDQVNDDFLTSYTWRRHVMTRLLTSGRSLTYIERNKAGGVANLWPLDEAATTVRVEAGRKVYEYRRANGEVIRYAAADVLDLAFNFKADLISHMSPLYCGRNAIGLAIAAERYASSVFRNGGVPPLVLKGPQMSPGAASRASEDFASILATARDKKRNVIVTPDGFSIEPIGHKASDMQVLDLRRFAITEIARLYSLPPIFLQDLSTGTYSNTEQQDLTLAKHTISRWAKYLEQEFNAKLTGPRNRDLVIEFNLDGLQRGDFEARMNGYATAIHAGFMTPDEVRALENRPAKPGGDQLLIQGATVPITSIESTPANV